MYISMWWEEVIHDDEVDLASIGYFNAMQSVEL